MLTLIQGFVNDRSGISFFSPQKLCPVITKQVIKGVLFKPDLGRPKQQKIYFASTRINLRFLCVEADISYLEIHTLCWERVFKLLFFQLCTVKLDITSRMHDFVWF